MCVQNDHTDMTILRGDDHIASSDRSGVTWITKGGETRGGRVIGLSEIDHFARSDRSYSESQIDLDDTAGRPALQIP